MKKLFTLLLVAAMLMAILAGCGGNEDPDANNSQPADSSPSGDVTDSGGEAKSTAVTIGYVGTHDSSYPSATNSNDFITQMMIYDKLFEADDFTGEITSRVLESWNWEDEVTLKLVMKQEVYFSNGNQATGDDLLYTLHSYILNGTRTDKNTYYQYIDFDLSYVDDDGFTVYVVWTTEYSQALLSLDCALMEKAFQLEHDETDPIWYTAPVGSGPYEITDVVMDSHIVFTLRDDYWNTDYSYDATQITLKFYSDETGMYVDYQNGVIDAMYDVSGTIVEQVETAGNQGAVNYVSAGSVSRLNLNESNEFLSNIKVREAVAYALDMEAIGQIAFGALYKEATSHVPEGFGSYVYHEGYTYDLDRAQAALDESGYKGSDITLKFVCINDGAQSKIGEAVQGYLSMLGINVVIENLDMATALPMMLQREGTDIQFMTRNGGNPMREASSLMAGNDKDSAFQCSAIYDADYNALADVATWNTDEAEILEACKELDDWLYDNYFALPICEQQGALVFNDRIASFDQSSLLKSCLGSLKLK